MIDDHVKALHDRIIELEQNIDKLSKLSSENYVTNFEKNIEEFKRRESLWQEQKNQLLESIAASKRRDDEASAREDLLKRFTFKKISLYNVIADR